jgi:hypothetical protein
MGQRRRQRVQFVSHGARIGLESPEPSIPGRVQAMLPGAVAAAPGNAVDVLYSLAEVAEASWALERRAGGGGPWAALASGVSLAELLRVLESDLHFQVAVRARTGLFVHAGAVGHNGLAIVIPGPSRSGKTSLVAALVRAGAAYYSDEYAVLDADGRVQPYAKPLSLRSGRSVGVGTPVEALGGCAGTTALPVGMVVWTTYSPGMAWRPRVMSGGQTALALLDSTLVARERPADALRFVKQAVADALGLTGPRGEADDVAPELVRQLDERP